MEGQWWSVCVCVVFACQLKMVIYVQTLKVAKGQKCGAAFVRLTHFCRLPAFVAVATADEINFPETSEVFCLLVLFNVTLHTCYHETIHSGTARQTSRDLTMDGSFMLDFTVPTDLATIRQINIKHNNPNENVTILQSS